VKIDVTSLPPAFHSSVKRTTIEAPPKVQGWIVEERARLKEDQKAPRFAERVYFDVGVLGTFGSFIFLIRDYITLDAEKKTQRICLPANPWDLPCGGGFRRRYLDPLCDFNFRYFGDSI
jgi:hypothetical protein